ncbi:MAG: O-antigen ligase family protein [Candidatus Planktophila sp.]|nr:O-antigen ligase family protein [Candidatus Planktophila sp.]
MLDTRSKKLLGTITLAALAAVTLVVAPYTLIDPINLPKLSALAFFSIVALSLLVPTIKHLFNSEFKILVILISLFAFQIVLVLLFSGANFGGQIYGTFGRNTGALAYLSLTVLLMSSALIADGEFIKKFLRVTVIVGVILIVYGNIQYFNLDPLPFVTAYTVNAPVGTLGNSNFQSAFMGIITVVAFTMALNKSFRAAIRVGLAIVGFAAVVVIYETLAKQGYFALLAGALVVVILWLFMNNRKTLGVAVSGFGAIGAGLVFLGLINFGPLASFLYKSSLEARGYYWRAAINMLIDHPFFGVGMDGYIDWFRRSRPSSFYENGFFSFSNSAHNVYLDIASNGGAPLILVYFAIIALVILSIFRVVKRNSGFDIHFVVIVGAWAAYQAQSIVSINQLGLAIWGWVLTGLIIGYEINTRDVKIEKDLGVKNKQPQRKAKVVTQQLSSATILRVFGGVMVGAIVVIPLYYANASFFSALKSGDIKAVQTAAYLKPIDERRLLHVATILRDDKMDSEAIAVLRDATKGYPDSFDFWQLWTTIPTAAPADIAAAKAEMMRLDPFNPDIR